MRDSVTRYGGERVTEEKAKSRALLFIRHGERSEAIQPFRLVLDRRVASLLAMTAFRWVIVQFRLDIFPLWFIVSTHNRIELRQ